MAGVVATQRGLQAGVPLANIIFIVAASVISRITRKSLIAEGLVEMANEQTVFAIRKGWTRQE